MAGIISDGKVDTDMLKAALKAAFANEPKVKYFGFTFTAEDANDLLAKLNPQED